MPTRFKWGAGQKTAIILGNTGTTICMPNGEGAKNDCIGIVALHRMRCSPLSLKDGPPPVSVLFFHFFSHGVFLTSSIFFCSFFPQNARKLLPLFVCPMEGGRTGEGAKATALSYQFFQGTQPGITRSMGKYTHIDMLAPPPRETREL